MVDISSGDKKINITVSTSGNKASVNATPDTAMYYSNKSREWAISDKIVSNEDYSSKYYANVSKQNADKSTATFENLTTNYNEYKTDLENTKDISVEEIETAKTNAISDITNQETLSVDNVNTAGSTQVNLAKEQATIATTQAGIATAKTSEVVESGNNAITAITEQETTSKNNIETKGTEQIELIQNEGATQIANVQSTGFYMRDDKLYFINSQGEETEFKSGGSSVPLGFIGQVTIPIDEELGLQRYANGSKMIINNNNEPFVKFIEEKSALYPSMVTKTQEEWDMIKTLSVFGQCGKYFVNREEGYIQLPLIINAQGLTDLAYFADTVAESLPNITGSIGVLSNVSGTADKGSGALLGVNSPADGTGATSGTSGNLKKFNYTFNASRSSSTYQDNAPVQQEAVQYPYFIQIATGAETENNIVNDIELNNPYSLFDFKWTDHEQNNLSWTRGDTFDWKPSGTYPSAYNELLSEYNNPESVEETESGITFKRSANGFKITTADMESEILSKYNTDGIAWYYILDTENKRFKLPRTRFGFEGLRGNVGDDITESLPYIGFTKDTSIVDGNLQFGTTGYTNYLTTNNPKVMVGNSGIMSLNAPVQERATQMYLYFYVGETVQNANLINAGRIGEQIASLSANFENNSMPMMSDVYEDIGLPTPTSGTEGYKYTVPAKGWLQIIAQRNPPGNTLQGYKIFNSGKQILLFAAPAFNASFINMLIPMDKGEQFFMVTDGTSTTWAIHTQRFFYGKGEI